MGHQPWPQFQNGIRERSIWRQNDHNHAKFVGAFHLSRRVSDENRACSISIRFFKITDPCVGRSFSVCSHDSIFGTNRNRILKNGSCGRALNKTNFAQNLMKYCCRRHCLWYLLLKQQIELVSKCCNALNFGFAFIVYYDSTGKESDSQLFHVIRELVTTSLQTRFLFSILKIYVSKIPQVLVRKADRSSFSGALQEVLQKVDHS